MFRFEELEIWKLAVDYGRDCYKIADKSPSHEYSLKDQLKRAGLSISNNIAEGSTGSNASFQKYLTIAIASALETVNIINFMLVIGFIKEQEKIDMYEKAEKIIRKVRSFSTSLK